MIVSYIRRWRKLPLWQGVIVGAMLLCGGGLRIYRRWVLEGQFEYFREHPVWLWGFGAYGVLVLSLLVAVIVSYVRRRRRRPVDQSEWPSS